MSIRNNTYKFAFGTEKAVYTTIIEFLVSDAFGILENMEALIENNLNRARLANLLDCLESQSSPTARDFDLFLRVPVLLLRTRVRVTAPIAGAPVRRAGSLEPKW